MTDAASAVHRGARERGGVASGCRLNRRLSTFIGESVGHYEGGDTLVIDTIGQTDRTFADNYRTPHTTQMHVIERWKLSADGNRVDVSVTVDDPGAFTTP
jgi:hypothetical protein